MGSEQGDTQYIEIVSADDGQVIGTYPYETAIREVLLPHVETKDDGIELVSLPYACFSVKLQAVTWSTISQVLEKAYVELHANPRYLFCSKADYEKIDAEIERCTNRCYDHPLLENFEQDWNAFLARYPHQHVRWISAMYWINQTTGRVMDITILPDLEDGTLLFGFLTS